MPNLVMSAGRVTAVWGQAFLIQPDGQLLPLKVGDILPDEARVLTSDDGIVEIAPDPTVAAVAPTEAPVTDVDQAITNLDQGLDDAAPAAGLSGGGEGGLLPGLRVDRVSEDVTPVTLGTNPIEQPLGGLPSYQTGPRAQVEPTPLSPTDTTPGPTPSPIVLADQNAVATALDTNLMIVLDVSRSMLNPSGIQGLSRLDASIQAIRELLDRYDQYGDVAVRLVTFSNDATVHGNSWLTVDAAKALLQTVQVQDATNYDFALSAAQAAFGTPTGKLSNAQNVSYFLSDGNPTLSSAYPVKNVHYQSANLTQPSLGDGIDATEEASWINFLEAHHIRSYAIGMGTDVTQPYLDPIAHDAQASAGMNGVVVTDFAQLANVLTGTTQDVVNGNLSLAGSLATSLGVHFDHVASITVDGVTHTFDAAQPDWSITTALGGTFSINLATGVYSYETHHTVAGIGSESMSFTLSDTSGNTGSATLRIQVDHALVREGGASDDLINGLASGDLLMGGAGQDLIQGGDGHDILLGQDGNDRLVGGAGNDILGGGKGSDMLIGGDGHDVFVWRLGDANGATDVIQDFKVASPADAGDVLDLRDLLQGEHAGVGGNNLDQYLSFARSGNDTVIQVSVSGHVSTGSDQQIVLQNVDLWSQLSLDASASSTTVIQQLLNHKQLVVDQA